MYSISYSAEYSTPNLLVSGSPTRHTTRQSADSHHDVEANHRDVSSIMNCKSVLFSFYLSVLCTAAFVTRS